MQTQKLYSRIYRYIRAGVALAILPTIIIYIIVARPDYRVIYGAAHFAMPVFERMGDIVTWPVRVAGKLANGIRHITTLQSQNEELQARLSNALRRENEFNVAVAEVGRLRNILKTQQAAPKNMIAADIRFDDAAFGHGTFFIDKGAYSGIKPGQAVINLNGVLIGQIIDAGADFARVRSLTDGRSNIPVRIAGTNVYGFLTGVGGKTPRLEFLSDPNFNATADLHVVTSGIRGLLPDGIPVGVMQNAVDVQVANPVGGSAVMVLEFDSGEKYK